MYLTSGVITIDVINAAIMLITRTVFFLTNYIIIITNEDIVKNLISIT